MSYFAVFFAALRLCVKCPMRAKEVFHAKTQSRKDAQSQTKTLPLVLVSPWFGRYGLEVAEMEQSRVSGRSWAILFARLVLGLIFFMAGFWKVFQLGPLQHARKYFLPFADTFLPVWSLWAVGVTIPLVELIAGGLVILGLRVREALIALGFVLAIVTFGHLLKEPLYEFHSHVIPRLALLLFVLMLPREDDRFSVDHFLGRRKA